MQSTGHGGQISGANQRWSLTVAATENLICLGLRNASDLAATVKLRLFKQPVVWRRYKDYHETYDPPMFAADGTMGTMDFKFPDGFKYAVAVRTLGGQGRAQGPPRKPLKLQ